MGLGLLDELRRFPPEASRSGLREPDTGAMVVGAEPTKGRDKEALSRPLKSLRIPRVLELAANQTRKKSKQTNKQTNLETVPGTSVNPLPGTESPCRQQEGVCVSLYISRLGK